MNHSLFIFLLFTNAAAFFFYGSRNAMLRFSRTSGIDHRRRFRHYFGSFMQETKKARRCSFDVLYRLAHHSCRAHMAVYRCPHACVLSAHLADHEPERIYRLCGR